MKAFVASLVVVVFAALMFVTTGTLFPARDGLLGDNSLALIHGGNDNSQIVSSAYACEYASTQGTNIFPQEDCDLLDDGTECLLCQGGSAQTQVPNSSGGPGGILTRILVACQNTDGQLGNCWQGECVYFEDYDCSGSPRIIYLEAN